MTIKGSTKVKEGEVEYAIKGLEDFDDPSEAVVAVIHAIFDAHGTPMQPQQAYYIMSEVLKAAVEGYQTVLARGEAMFKMFKAAEALFPDPEPKEEDTTPESA